MSDGNVLSARDRSIASRRGMGGIPAQALKEMRSEASDRAFDLLFREYRVLAAQITPEQTQRALREIEDLRDSEGCID